MKRHLCLLFLLWLMLQAIGVDAQYGPFLGPNSTVRGTNIATSLRQYGATGDGTSDADALQDAINAATDGTVISIHDVYSLGTNGWVGIQIYSKTNLTIVGLGEGAGFKTLFLPSQTEQSIPVVFHVTNCQNVVFKNLDFDGNSINSGFIGFNSCDQHVVEGCYMHDLGTSDHTGANVVSTGGSNSGYLFNTLNGGSFNGVDGFLLGTLAAPESSVLIVGNNINGCDDFNITGFYENAVIENNTTSDCVISLAPKIVRGNVSYYFSHLTNAVNNLENGDRLCIPNGVHEVTPTSKIAGAGVLVLTTKRNILIEGEGHGSIIQALDAGQVWQINNCTNVTMRDFSIYGYQTNSRYWDGATGDYYAHIKLDNTNAHLKFINLYMQDGQHGISHLSNDKADKYVEIIGCTFSNYTKIGSPTLNLDGSAISGIGSHWKIINNVFIDNGRDVEWESVNYPTKIYNGIASHNTHIGTWDEAYMIWPCTTNSDSISDISILYNVITNMSTNSVDSSYGIECRGGRNIKIIGNTFDGLLWGGTGYNDNYAITIGAGASQVQDANNILIKDNIFDNFGANAVLIDQGNGHTVSNFNISYNYFRNETAASIGTVQVIVIDGHKGIINNNNFGFCTFAGSARSYIELQSPSTDISITGNRGIAEQTAGTEWGIYVNPLVTNTYYSGNIFNARIRDITNASPSTSYPSFIIDNGAPSDSVDAASDGSIYQDSSGSGIYEISSGSWEVIGATCPWSSNLTDSGYNVTAAGDLTVTSNFVAGTASFTTMTIGDLTATNILYTTNALPSMALDISTEFQSTNCSASLTFASLTNVDHEKIQSATVIIYPNGSDRTIAIPASWVPSGAANSWTLYQTNTGFLTVMNDGVTSTNAAFAQIGMDGNTITGDFSVTGDLSVGGTIGSYCELSIAGATTLAIADASGFTNITDWEENINVGSFTTTVTNMTVPSDGNYLFTINASFETATASEMECKLYTNEVAVADAVGNEIGWKRTQGAVTSDGVVAASRILTLDSGTAVSWKLDAVGADEEVTWNHATFRAERK